MRCYVICNMSKRNEIIVIPWLDQWLDQPANQQLPYAGHNVYPHFHSVCIDSFSTHHMLSCTIVSPAQVNAVFLRSHNVPKAITWRLIHIAIRWENTRPVMRNPWRKTDWIRKSPETWPLWNHFGNDAQDRLITNRNPWRKKNSGYNICYH